MTKVRVGEIIVPIQGRKKKNEIVQEWKLSRASRWKEDRLMQEKQD